MFHAPDTTTSQVLIMYGVLFTVFWGMAFVLFKKNSK